MMLGSKRLDCIEMEMIELAPMIPLPHVPHVEDAEYVAEMKEYNTKMVKYNLLMIIKARQLVQDRVFKTSDDGKPSHFFRSVGEAGFKLRIYNEFVHFF